MSDLISRQAVLKEIDRECRKYPESFFVGFAIAADIVAKQPSVERKKGKWGKKNECSECGCQPWYERDIHTLNYCPNCGAEMEREE